MAKKRVFVVYVIRNALDKKRYIGKTSGRNFADAIERRWRQHLSLARNGRGWRLHHAMRKHGVQSFEIGHLHICRTESGAFALEKREIARFAPEYNSTAGGDGGAGYKWTEKQKEAITGRRHTVEARAKMSVSQRNRGPRGHLGERTRLAISQALTGVRRGPLKAEHREKLRQVFLGKPKTPEHARKISLGKIGKPYHLTKLRAATLAIKQARDTGSKVYLTGSPCKRGHTSPRYISTRQCCECHRIRWSMHHAPQRQMETQHV